MKTKINSVWLRATVLFFLIVISLTGLSTFVGIYFGSKSITSTVHQDLIFFNKMASNMLEMSIDRLINDCDYISTKLNRSYTEGFAHVNSQGENINILPGKEAFYAAAMEEATIGREFFHLAALIPEFDNTGNPIPGSEVWIEAVRSPHIDAKTGEIINYDFAKLDLSKAEEYKAIPIPLNPDDVFRSIVFGIPDITPSGTVVIRGYVYRESGILVILTAKGDVFSEFANTEELRLYEEGRIALFGSNGYIYLATDINMPGFGIKVGQFYTEDNTNFKLDPVYWNNVKRTIENGQNFLNGSSTEKPIEFMEFTAGDKNRIFFTAAPIVAGNNCLSFVTTVPINASPISDIRRIFYIFGIVFIILGFAASIFFGFLQSRPYDQILKLKNSAEEASRVKGDFLSNMSHEIRTPLNAVMGMAEIAEKATDITRKDYCISKIKDASQHLMGVISDILDMSKIEADKLELDMYPFSSQAMLEKLKDVFFFRFQEKNQTFNLISDNMPPFIKSDEQRIAQVLANLISNAIKFTPENGSISLIAKQTTESDNEGFFTLEFSVIDTGVGIPKEAQTKLFQAFQQADRSISRKYGGTGLGLAISKRIADLLNGDIYINSRQGEGATFVFSMRTQIANAPNDGETETITLENMNLEGITILLAEDIQINREIVSAFLEMTKVRIIEAENGEQAVKIFKEYSQDIDMILMDIQMPEMNGYDATRKIRSLGFEKAETVPIIAMTANVFKDDIERCFAAGMNGHIGKPVDINEMFLQLKKHLKL